MIPQPVRIAIVNDYDLVVAGLTAALAPYADRVEIVEIDAGRPVESKVDLVLYDTFSQLQLDDCDLSDVTLDPDARVVVISWATDAAHVRRAVSAGAAGYLAKSLAALDLVAGIERIHAGEQVLSTGDPEPLANAEILGRWPGDLYGLSPREGEVLALICQGLTNEDITQRAYISMNTVKTHIRALYRKIGVTTRSQAVRWGIERDFAPDRTRIKAPGAPASS